MEPIFHYLIPVFALLSIFPRFFRRFGYKKIFLLGLLSIAPDLDVLFGMHRYLFHNIFFVIILALIIYFLAGKVYGLLGLYFLGGHLLFDLNKYGIALLYPFSKLFMGFEFGFYKHSVKGYNFLIDFFVVKPEVVAGMATKSWYLNPMGALVLVLVSVLILVKFIQTRLK